MSETKTKPKTKTEKAKTEKAKTEKKVVMAPDESGRLRSLRSVVKGIDQDEDDLAFAES